MKQRKLRKPVIIVLAVILTAVLAAAGYAIFDRYTRNRERQELYDSLVLSDPQETRTFECGAFTDAESLFASDEGTVTVEGEVDPNTPGTYPVTVTLRAATAHGESVSRSYPVRIVINDNTIPEIVLKEDTVEIHTGEEADYAENVGSVHDEKDGELPYAEQEEPGSYTVVTDAKTDTPGEYTVTVAANDNDGHRVTAEYRLVVSEVSEERNPYRIRINRELNTVTVYSADSEGNYTVPLKAMVCSTGGATPVGVFHTFNRSTWRALFGGVYGQYATDIVGDILFHSVPYYSMNKGDLEYLEYDKLGTKASLGCIRMAVADVLWIFNNCPIGTEVEIYDDPDDPGPLGKPEPIYIDPESENRGWDPTDPDPNNPWNN